MISSQFCFESDAGSSVSDTRDGMNFWRSISAYAVTNSRDSASLQLDPRELDEGAVAAGVAGTGVSGAGELEIAINTSLLLIWWQLRRLVGTRHSTSGKSQFSRLSVIPCLYWFENNKKKRKFPASRLQI